MANTKYKKLSQHEKLEQARAAEQRLAKSKQRKKTVVSVFSVIICILLVFAFCFPAVTMLIH